MATVQDFVDDISRDIPDPLDTVVARHVRSAMQDFFRSSESWRHTESLPLTSLARTIYFGSLPFDVYVLATSYAYLTLVNGERRKLTATLSHRIDPNVTGTTSMFALVPDGIILDGNEEGTVEVGVIIQPNAEIDELPDDVSLAWYDFIRHGSMARLLRMPQQPWTDYKGSQVNEALFREGIERAKTEARNERSRPKRSVRFNTGFSW